MKIEQAIYISKANLMFSGKSAVVTTDCAPHWAPPEFCEWEYYNRMWQGIMNWLTK